jgi:tRNA threonylcarbamoyladenosine biosynthesis protein TsaE
MLGVQLGKMAKAGDIFLLIGDLGTGKTCLTQGIARGLGVKDYVSSPSFVLVKEYYGRLPLYHIDLYRLNVGEVEDLGLEEYLYGKGVCVIEWAEKAFGILPQEQISVKIEHLSETERKIYLEFQCRPLLLTISQLFDKLEFGAGPHLKD